MSKDDEFSRSMRIPKLCLNFTGVQIDQPSHTTFVSFFKKHYLYILNILIAGSCIPCEICWCWSSKQGFVGLTYMIPSIVYEILGFVKIANTLHKLDITSKLIKELHDMFPGNINYKDEGEDIDDEEEGNILTDSLKLSKKVVFVLFWVNLLLAATFGLRPLAVLAYKYFVLGKMELSLPLYMMYPFDAYDLRFWPIAYVHQIWSSALAIMNLIGPDTLFFVCCTQMYMQFRMLKRRLEIFVTGSERGDEEVAKKFSILTKRHQKLIELVNMLESVYSTTIFLNYGCSSFLICFTGFNVTTLNDAWSVLNFLVFFFSNVFQIFLICLFGDLIMNSSVGVADGLYNCKWYATTPKIRRSILFYLLRSQKPCKLTAINFADVNLKSFTTILSRSWSYFALLRTVLSTKTPASSHTPL